MSEFHSEGSPIDRIVRRRGEIWGQPRTMVPGMAWLAKKAALRNRLKQFETDFMERRGSLPAPEHLWSAARFLERRGLMKPPREGHAESCG